MERERKQHKKQHKVKAAGPRFLLRHFPQVKEVIDSRKRVEIRVTNHDCTAGKAKRPTECALAKAIKREYNADGAIIGMTYSYIIKGNKAVRFQTPESVSREIVSFDRHSDFAPGNYALSPVYPSHRLGHERTRSPHTGGHNDSRIVHKYTARVREIT